MSEKQNNFECQIVCWGIAAVVGIAAMVMLWMFAEFDGNQAVFTGGLIGLLLGIVLSLFVCRGQTAAADLAAEEKPAQRYAREAEEIKAKRLGGSAPAAGSGSTHAESAASGSSNAGKSSGDASAAGGGAAESAGAAPAASTAPASLMSEPVKPSAALAGEAELAGRKGEWKYEKDGEAATSAKSGAKVDKSAAIPAGETAAPAVEPVETAASVEESAPKLYDAAPSEGADDLKLISGVGPKLEQTLNDMGIYRFEQVAAWGAQEIAWVDARLRFKGRIERDDWMSQAKILADGGETEFSKKKKK